MQTLLQVLVIMLGLIAAVGIAMIVVRLLAEINVIFTYVPEGRGRIITLNGKFTRAVLSLTGYTFRSDTKLVEFDVEKRRIVTDEYTERPETDDELIQRLDPHPWDVVPDRTHRSYSTLNPLNYLSGVYWVGIPPFADIFRHVFRWTSYEQTGEQSTERVPKPHEKELDYFLVQTDVYYVIVQNAETSGQEERLPVSIEVLLTLRIANPFKAFSRVQRWLELVTDQTDSRVRRLVGNMRYNDIVGQEESVSFEIGKAIADLSDELFREYGISMEKVQILSVDPPDELREITLAQYTATERGKATVITARKAAEARRIEADAEEQYIRRTDGVLAEINPDALRWYGVRKGNLTTLVESGAIRLPGGKE